MWSFYQRWRDDSVSDPTGKDAFARAVGMTPEQANTAWIGWLKSDDATR